MARITHELPNDTRLDGYTIQRVIGGGGFSIVYLATDDTGRKVVIKEYMPSKLAVRDEQLDVVASQDHFVERFAHGRRLFFQEAGTLSSIKHPNIVNVINFFRQHGTVYMVMEFEEGVNLQGYILKHKGKMSEAFILTVFNGLLDGLQHIHSKGLLHLDIKPGNIHLRPGGRPLLLDFGAVHEMMHTRQFQPNQVVTPGYSPIEQLDPGGYVGPWTDIYAIGATMRTCMSGQPPMSATKRRERDSMRPAVYAFKKGYSQRLLSAVDRAMEVDPMLRPQSVEELQALLARGEPDNAVEEGG
ncbi:serine/threonine-protein kinase [Thiohalophilus sp.]|uniref:serine/threonine protein kinase n=1 Tax=Thiohalophilus sp. TaxID=3028392 RepID=UPI002ACE3FD5|nr:serine/threonine-protein kinase [Thiohalophilus sp.]MDZ7803665.1 serine/threonine-protein kinase [Thiohalophilus sp.]